MIRTIGELKKVIANIDDDFTINARIVRELSEEELSGSNYPYPYEYTKANLEIGDIGYSDKDVFINVEEISDDMCEWHCDEYGRYHTECHSLADNDPLEYTYCPYCGKKIKVVEQMNTRKVDKSKKSNIKCEHCEAYDKDSGWCCIQEKEKNYWNRCKDFIWNHKY